MSKPSLAERLPAEHPWAPGLVAHYIDAHAPPPGAEPVTLPREIHDALCLLALVGLEALDVEKP